MKFGRFGEKQPLLCQDLGTQETKNGGMGEEKLARLTESSEWRSESRESDLEKLIHRRAHDHDHAPFISRECNINIGQIFLTTDRA